MRYKDRREVKIKSRKGLKAFSGNGQGRNYSPQNVREDQMLENYLTENAENAPSVKISKMDKLHK